MSTILAPSKQYIAANAANARVFARARPGQQLQLFSPHDFDKNGNLKHNLHLQESQIPFFDVDSRNPVYTMNTGPFLEDETLMRNSPDWQVRWESQGRLRLCKQYGFKLSNDPFAPFEMPDTVTICFGLTYRTDSVGKDWYEATAHFPLIPSHQLLPVYAPPSRIVRCPYADCHHIIHGAQHVEDHLATAHFFDDPRRTWLAQDLFESTLDETDCPCAYDRMTGVELENGPFGLNRKEFLDHIILFHFYDKAVYCRFCGISFVCADMYPSHILECQTLRPWHGVTDVGDIQ